MLTDRGKLLLAASLPLWLVSRTFGIPEVSVAALACPTLVLVALVYTRVASARLAIRRRVYPTRLFHDAEGEVTLEVRNDGRLPTAILQIEDDTPPALCESPRFVLPALAPGRSVRLRYTLQAQLRGRYDVGPARVHLRDPFGVAQRPVRFGRTDEVIVYPPVWALPNVLPRIGRIGTTTDGAARPLATRGEFANVREYVRGDDLRKVHWKSTAHRGKLMVRQDESPQETTATIVLDARRRDHHGSGPLSTLEHAIAAAASAAYHLTDHGYGLRFIDGPISGRPPGMSWRMVLDRLAVLEAGRGESFAPVWQQLGRGAAGDGLLLAIAPAPRPAELREIVRAGRAFAVRAALLVLPPRQRDAEQRAERAVDALRKAGWHVARHRVGDRIDDSWRDFALRPLRQVAS